MSKTRQRERKKKHRRIVSGGGGRPGLTSHGRVSLPLAWVREMAESASPPTCMRELMGKDVHDPAVFRKFMKTVQERGGVWLEPDRDGVGGSSGVSSRDAGESGYVQAVIEGERVFLPQVAFVSAAIVLFTGKIGWEAYRVWCGCVIVSGEEGATAYRDGF